LFSSLRAWADGDEADFDQDGPVGLHNEGYEKIGIGLQAGNRREETKMVGKGRVGAWQALEKQREGEGKGRRGRSAQEQHQVAVSS